MSHRGADSVIKLVCSQIWLHLAQDQAGCSWTRNKVVVVCCKVQRQRALSKPQLVTVLNLHGAVGTAPCGEQSTKVTAYLQYMKNIQ